MKYCEAKISQLTPHAFLVALGTLVVLCLLQAELEDVIEVRSHILQLATLAQNDIKATSLRFQHGTSNMEHQTFWMTKERHPCVFQH